METKYLKDKMEEDNQRVIVLFHVMPSDKKQNEHKDKIHYDSKACTMMTFTGQKKLKKHDNMLVDTENEKLIVFKKNDKYIRCGTVILQQVLSLRTPTSPPKMLLVIRWLPNEFFTNGNVDEDVFSCRKSDLFKNMYVEDIHDNYRQGIVECKKKYMKFPPFDVPQDAFKVHYKFCRFMIYNKLI